jgi:RHS repeat-associated protein
MSRSCYDDRWRLVSVWRQNTKGTLNILTGANAPPGQRPPPALYERIIHRYTGRGGTGEGWFHDAPIYSQINKDWKFDIYGDDLIDGDEQEEPDPESGYTPDNDLCPTWEIERQYLQSQIDGDILGVIDYFADGSRQTTRFDYSMFGLPRLLPTNTVPGSAFGGDIDNDDNINNGLHPDGQSDISDLIAFLIMFENGDPRGDLANATGHPIPDGGIDVSDLVYMLQQFQGGLSVTAEPVRFGWRAYQWDGRLNLHHVRHRVFDPKLITWLQPDPLGEVDGPNVYAYVAWDPFNKIDPFGLASSDACGCDSNGVPNGIGPGAGSGGDPSSHSRDPFEQAGLGNLDENTRAGSGPRNEQSAELRMQTLVGGEAYLNAVTAPLDPENYVRLLQQALTNPVQLWIDTVQGIAQTVSDVWNFNDLSPRRQAELFGGGLGSGLWMAGGALTKAASSMAGAGFVPIARSRSAGGTYLLLGEPLLDGHSRRVIRTGQSGNLAHREYQHSRTYTGLRFVVDREINSGLVDRLFREQYIHELYRPILNKRSPIGAYNPLIYFYNRAKCRGEVQ